MSPPPDTPVIVQAPEETSNRWLLTLLGGVVVLVLALVTLFYLTAY